MPAFSLRIKIWFTVRSSSVEKRIWYNDNNINSILILFIAKLGKNPQFLDCTTTCISTHSTQYMETTKARWPRSWHSALSSLYRDYIFMYSYFLGSPTGDSQNGASGVNFTEHGFLPDRGCSQPIFHRWSKQQSSERGSGDRCSVEDSKIHRKKEKK